MNVFLQMVTDIVRGSTIGTVLTLGLFTFGMCLAAIKFQVRK